MIEFAVAGIPQPAGSKRAFAHRTTQRIVVVDDAKGSRQWKTDVGKVARETMAGRPPLDGPLELIVVFVMPRPKSHYRTGRFAAELKPNAPAVPTVKPDVLKLARAVEDAMTGIVYTDDAQIVHEIVSKRYGAHPSAQIFVAEFASGEVSQIPLPMEVPA